MFQENEIQMIKQKAIIKIQEILEKKVKQIEVEQVEAYACHEIELPSDFDTCKTNKQR